jgi:hypothetical protein
MKFVLILLAVMPAPAAAQSRNFTIDLQPVGGTLTMTWRVADRAYMGLGLGGGTDEFGHTLRPTGAELFHDLEQILHLDFVGRYKPTARIDVDAGGRLGFGGVRECRASDCLPGGYAGVFAGVFMGSRRWKLGTRILAATVYETPNRDNVLHWEILNVRYSR